MGKLGHRTLTGTLQADFTCTPREDDNGRVPAVVHTLNLTGTVRLVGTSRDGDIKVHVAKPAGVHCEASALDGLSRVETYSRRL